MPTHDGQQTGHEKAVAELRTKPADTDTPAADPPEPILRYFAVEHLPAKLQAVSRPFADLALGTIMQLPRSPERTVALRKLLESKDAAVRAAL